MIKSENKRVQLTLDPESIELLTTICLRFNITKTQAIKQALKVFASKRKHQITLIYREPDIHQDKPVENNESSELDNYTIEEILNNEHLK